MLQVNQQKCISHSTSVNEAVILFYFDFIFKQRKGITLFWCIESAQASGQLCVPKSLLTKCYRKGEVAFLNIAKKY